MKTPWFTSLTVVLLIAGTTIGAGMLALPIKTGLSGFFPSLVGMALVWGLMLAAAWVLADGMIATGHSAADLPTLFQQSLGTPGKWLSTIGYLIIFYGLLVAYLSGAATVLADLVPLPVSKTAWLVIFFTAATALVILGLDVARKGNAVLMALLAISFLFLLLSVGKHLQPGHLGYTDWHFLPAALPIVVCAFSFHGIIPAVCRSLDGNRRACRRALLLGTLLALAVNSLWMTAVTGALPLAGEGRASILGAFEKNLPATVPLAIYLDSAVITTAGTLFALAAIFTSYIGVGVALMGFCGDLVSSQRKMHPRLWEGTLAFGPPLGVALIYPGLFLEALDMVGGFGILLVFGVLPSLMLIRSGKEASSRRRVWGYAMTAVFALLMLLELSQEAGWLQIRPNAEYWHGG